MGVSHPGVAVTTLVADPTSFLGIGTIFIQPPPTNIIWRIFQLSITSTIPGLLSLDVRLSGIPFLTAGLWLPPVTAQGDPPIDVRSHDTLEVHVIGAIGAVISAAYYFEEI